MSPPTTGEQAVTIETPDARLAGFLTQPPDSQALVLFAHGSGSSRLSPRNRFVAEVLNRGGLATLLFDLLTPEEHLLDQRTAELRFDIGLLARRLGDAVDWAGGPVLRAPRIGLFGASTGAAAALKVAATRPERISAVVSRGGRPDLAGEALPGVEAPTLLIIGGLDTTVLDLNREAAARLACEHDVAVVPGATHLFEEPGTLAQAAELARDWFRRHLVSRP